MTGKARTWAAALTSVAATAAIYAVVTSVSWDTATPLIVAALICFIAVMALYNIGQRN
jgi:hypothetical protein